MVQPRIEVKPSRPLEGQPRSTVRVVGSTIIARFTSCMLNEPRPATPVSPDK
jgi:hypothetical protein